MIKTFENYTNSPDYINNPDKVFVIEKYDGEKLYLVTFGKWIAKFTSPNFKEYGQEKLPIGESYPLWDEYEDKPYNSKMDRDDAIRVKVQKISEDNLGDNWKELVNDKDKFIQLIEDVASYWEEKEGGLSDDDFDTDYLKHMEKMKKIYTVRKYNKLT